MGGCISRRSTRTECASNRPSGVRPSRRSPAKTKTLKNGNIELHSYSTTAAEPHKGRRCQVELKYKVFRGKHGRLYFEVLESTRWERTVRTPSVLPSRWIRTVRPASVFRDDRQQKLRHSKIEIQSFISTLLLLLNIIKEGGVKQS